MCIADLGSDEAVCIDIKKAEVILRHMFIRFSIEGRIITKESMRRICSAEQPRGRIN